MRRTLLAVLALLSLSIGAFAADATGKWTAEVTGRGGNTQTMTFTFKVDGAALTGSVANQMGEAPISDGKVDGDNISFKQVLSFGGNDITLSYKGVVEGDKITMVREVAGRGGAPRPFIAKRVQ